MGEVFRVDKCFPDLKRTLERRGFIPADEDDTNLWDFRYSIKQSTIGDDVDEEQVINFFRRNREFCSKSCLASNLTNVSEHSDGFESSYHLFPRCFDLATEEGIAAFSNDFKWTTLLSWIKGLALHLEMTRNGQATLMDSNKRDLSYHPEVSCNLDITEIDDVPLPSTSAFLLDPTISLPPLDNEAIESLISLAQSHINPNEAVLDSQSGITSTFPDTDWETLLSTDNTLRTFNQTIDTRITSILATWKSFDPQFSLTTHRTPLWVLKPSGLSRGRGVKVLTELNEILAASKRGMFIVQKYVENTILVSERNDRSTALGVDQDEDLNQTTDARYLSTSSGKKFDIRLWALVTDWNPLGVWFYEDFYCRVAARDFSYSKKGRFIHLTNNSVAKKAEGWDQESSMFHCHELRDMIGRLGVRQLDAWSAEKDEFDDDVQNPQYLKLVNQMKKITYASLASCADLVTPRRNSFELIGLDFILDDELKPWLLEINTSPDLSPSTQVTSKLVRQMFPDMCKVLFDIEGFCSGRFERHWTRKFLNAIDSGRFTLLRPNLRRPAVEGLALKIDGAAMKIRRQAFLKGKAVKRKKKVKRDDIQLIEDEKITDIRKGGNEDEVTIVSATTENQPNDHHSSSYSQESLRQEHALEASREVDPDSHGPALSRLRGMSSPAPQSKPKRVLPPVKLRKPSAVSRVAKSLPTKILSFDDENLFSTNSIIRLV